MDQLSPYSCWHAHLVEQSVFLKFSSMMQLRFVILSLCTLVMSSTLAAQAPLVANPLALSKDSAVQRITHLHEKTLDLSKVVLNGEKAFFQSQAEIGRLHQTMNGLLIERGWSFEEAISNQDQNGKRAARIHEKQAKLLHRTASRKWRKASGRETLLECCVVLSLYHEFQAPDGIHEYERIALKIEEYEWAQIDEEEQKKSRRRNVIVAAASVATLGVFVVGLPVVLVILAGGFVS